MSYLKTIKRLLLLAGIVILIAFMVSIDLAGVLEALSGLSLIPLGVVFALTFANVLTKALRWKLLIEKTTTSRLSMWYSFCSILAGVSAGSVVPARIEIGRPLMLKATHKVPLSRSMSVLIVERFQDFLVFFCFFTVSLMIVPGTKIIDPFLVFLFTGIFILVVLSLIFFPRPFILISQKILHLVPLPYFLKTRCITFTNSLFSDFSLFKKKGELVLFALLSFLANGIEIVRFYFLLQFLGVEVTLAITTLTFTAATLLGIFSLIPGGIGISEVSSSNILQVLLPLADSSSINTAVFLDRIIAYYLLVVLGSGVLIHYSAILKKMPVSEEHKSFK